MTRVNNKLKLLMILGIALLSMLVFGTTVNAGTVVSGTPDKNSLDDIPSIITLDMKTTAVDKVEDTVYKQVVTSLKAKGIEVIDGEDGNITLDVSVEIPTEASQHYIEKGRVFFWDSVKQDVIVDKNFTINWTNKTPYSEADQKYIDGLVKTFPENICKYVELGQNPGSRVDYAIETLSKLVNDNSIIFVRNGMGSGGAGSFELSGGGNIGLSIARNGVFYGFTAPMSGLQYYITIPSNIENTDTAYINYALPKIKSYLKDISYEDTSKINMEKISGGMYKVYDSDNKDNYDTILLKSNIDNIIKNITKNNTSYKNLKYDEAQGRYTVDLIVYSKLEATTPYNQEQSTLEKAINDKSITLKSKGATGGGGDLIFTEHRQPLFAVYKDGLHYTDIEVHIQYRSEIVVPSNVEDTDKAYADYAKSKWSEISKKDNMLSDNTLQKIEKVSGYYYKYTYKMSDYQDTGYVIIKKADGTPVGNNIFVDNLQEGANVKVEVKENVKMAQELKNKGYNNILGSYELKLDGATKLTNPIDVTFNVGTEHNNKMVYILHHKQDGTYENFEKKVANGKVTVTVSELSPFVLALKENTTQEPTTTDKPHIKDETPKTGTDNNIVATITSILSVLSVASIAIIKKF